MSNHEIFDSTSMTVIVSCANAGVNDIKNNAKINKVLVPCIVLCDSMNRV